MKKSLIVIVKTLNGFSNTNDTSFKSKLDLGKSQNMPKMKVFGGFQASGKHLVHDVSLKRIIAIS